MANVLRSKTLENFVEVLAKDGLNSGSVHDVQRYINDMLAFIHHVFASQYELLFAILRNAASNLSTSCSIEHSRQVSSEGDLTYE
ncbi:hypothetical protein DNF23_57240, partial [Pseudomonas syringae pv. pisi]